MIMRRIAPAAIAAIAFALSARNGFAASGCNEALAQPAVCGGANEFAVDAMRKRPLEAVPCPCPYQRFPGGLLVGQPTAQIHTPALEPWTTRSGAPPCRSAKLTC